MCTYVTEKVAVRGSGRGAAAWFSVTEASVCWDHPQHTAAEHTLNLDFLNPERGPSARVAIELSEESARRLARAILATLPDPG